MKFCMMVHATGSHLPHEQYCGDHAVLIDAHDKSKNTIPPVSLAFEIITR
jgi:hypothetical protein